MTTTSVPNQPPEPPGTIVVDGKPIPTGDVRLIVGESGLNLGGGEMILWKRNIVVTTHGRYVGKSMGAFNAIFFDRWLEQCPQAIGILPNGTIKLPKQRQETGDPLATLGEILTLARKELRRRFLKAFGFATIFFLIGAAIIGLVITYNILNPNNLALFKVGTLGLILVVGALLIGGRGLMLLSRYRNIIRLFSGVKGSGELRSDLLEKTLAPDTPALMTLHPSPNAATLISATLAILGLLTMFCFFVGIPLSLVAFALNHPRRNWVRTVAIIGLVGACLTGVVVGIALLFNR